MNVYFSDTLLFEERNKYYGLQPIHNQNNISYRLNMMHSFSPHVQIYTLTETNSGATMDVREFTMDTTYRQNLRINYEVTLSLADWEGIKNKIDSSCYWSNQFGKERCEDCLDGGFWMLEGYDPEMKNCAGRARKFDACDFESKGELGNLCRTIRKYAREEELHVHGTPQAMNE